MAAKTRNRPNRLFSNFLIAAKFAVADMSNQLFVVQSDISRQLIVMQYKLICALNSQSNANMAL